MPHMFNLAGKTNDELLGIINTLVGVIASVESDIHNNDGCLREPSKHLVGEVIAGRLPQIAQAQIAMPINL